MFEVPILRRRMDKVHKYPTDPASAKSTRKPVLPAGIFDVPRMMSYVRAGMIDACPELEHPNDELLIATMIELGMPRWSADQVRYNPTLRVRFIMTWEAVQEAAKGNPEMQDKIDAIRETFAQMRVSELVSDIPNHTVGFWER